MSLTLNMVGGGGGVSINTITVDFYSAASDTVSYINPTDGLTHTVTTNSSGYVSAQIAILKDLPTTITFTSSVANDPTNLSNYYSKSITLTDSTTSIYVMPDDFIYWYGTLSSKYGAGDLKDLGYSANIETYSISNVTFSTNSFKGNYTDQSRHTAGVGTNNQVDLSQFAHICAITRNAVTGDSGKFNGTFYNTNKQVIRQADGYIHTSSLALKTQDISNVTTNAYVGINANWDNDLVTYALWLE